MKRSKRIDSIKKVKSVSEKNAMRKLSEALAARQSAQLRHQDLLTFRAEYSRDMTERGRQGIAAGKLVEYQQFLLNLDRAIEEQAKIVEQQSARVEQLQTVWRLHRNALKGVDNLLDKILVEEQKQEQAVEQKQTDELSLRMLKQNKT